MRREADLSWHVRQARQDSDAPFYLFRLKGTSVVNTFQELEW